MFFCYANYNQPTDSSISLSDNSLRSGSTFIYVKHLHTILDCCGPIAIVRTQDPLIKRDGRLTRPYIKYIGIGHFVIHGRWAASDQNYGPSWAWKPRTSWVCETSQRPIPTSLCESEIYIYMQHRLPTNRHSISLHLINDEYTATALWSKNYEIFHVLAGVRLSGRKAVGNWTRDIAPDITFLNKDEMKRFQEEMGLHSSTLKYNRVRYAVS